VLSLAAERIDGKWSGAGPQVAVALLQNSAVPELIHPFAACTLDRDCSVVTPQLENGASYLFRLRAINAAGLGPFSAAVGPLTLPPLRTPLAPRPPELSSAGAAELTVAVQHAPLEAATAQEAVTLYEFQRTAVHAAAAAAVGKSIEYSAWLPAGDAPAPPGTGFGPVLLPVQELDPQQQHVFRVRAHSSAGAVGPWSAASVPLRTADAAAAAAAVAVNLPPLAAPTVALLSDAEASSSSSSIAGSVLRVSWAAEQQRAYTLQRRREGDAADYWTDVKLTAAEATAGAAVVHSLAPYSRYSFRVKVSQAGADWSPPSQWIRTAPDLAAAAATTTVGTPAKPAAPLLQAPVATALANSSVELQWTAFSPVPATYTVELAQGPYSEAFAAVATISTSSSSSSSAASAGSTTAVLTQLTPLAQYRVRVCGAPHAGCTPALAVTAPAALANTWQRLTPRKLAPPQVGGRTAPVLTRPHLSPLAEVLAQGAALDTAAALIGPGPYGGLPSARSGHSALAARGELYIFGGASSSSDCSGAVASLRGLAGTTATAAAAVPLCTRGGGLGSELWRFSPGSSVWKEISVNGASPQPSARRGHSTPLLGASELLLLGGLDSSATAQPLSQLWRLDVAPRTALTAAWSSPGGVPLPLQQGSYTWLTAAVPAGGAAGMCITDISVAVTLDHPCSRQLKLVLRGPGTPTADANFAPLTDRTAGSVALFSFAEGGDSPGICAGGGLSGTVFSDSAQKSVSGCRGDAPYAGLFKPAEPLLPVFGGLPAAGQWSLGVLDAAEDSSSGSIAAWSVQLTVTLCSSGGSSAHSLEPPLQWSLQTATGAVPAARYSMRTVAIGSSVYVLGGKGQNGLSLASELYRLDTTAAGGVWQALAPTAALTTPAGAGAALLLLESGLLAVSGSSSSSTSGFGSGLGTGGSWGGGSAPRVYLMDMVTRQWGHVTVTSAESVPGVEAVPQGRTQVAAAVLYSGSAALSSSGSSAAGESVLLSGGWNGVHALGDLWRLELPAEVRTL
jgi:subtilisin-like proprotein convertase family protein